MVERLYTPWRLAYVTSQGDATGCALCRAREHRHAVIHVERRSSNDQ